MEPKGKVAVISGGASGIGLATAQLLASHGARLVLVDLQQELGEQVAAELQAQGVDAAFLQADVTKRGDVQEMLDFAVRRMGRVDICFNNAGISEAGEDFLAPESRRWERTLEVNLKGVLLATQLEVELLRKQGGGGVIVNTASMGGLVPMPNSPIYAASKAGVIHFSRSLAYLADEGIRVNAICPSYTDTPLVRSQGEEAVRRVSAEVGGILHPEQIAEGVLELVRDESRAGAVMRVTVARGIDYAFERQRGG